MGKCLLWSKQSLPSPAITSLIYSPSSGRVTISYREFACRLPEQSLQLSHPPKTGGIWRSRSWPGPEPRCRKLQRSCSASDDSLYDEEFDRSLQEFERRFHRPANDDSGVAVSESSKANGSTEIIRSFRFKSLESAEPPWAAEEDEVLLPAAIERKASSVDLPFSLRMLKRKRQLQDRLEAAGESACCSVKKAFSSMVFIVRELQSYALQMRENVFCEDLEAILGRVHEEIHAVFVCLFQRIFSRTPALMVSVMILLANFTVHSMTNAAIITVPAAPSAALEETIPNVDNGEEMKFGTSSVKSFSVSGEPASIGGCNGGGGKAARSGSGPTDGGDGTSEKMVVSTWDRYQRVFPEESSIESESESDVRLWKSVVEEASRMRSDVENEALDEETTAMLVSPVVANIVPEDLEVYSRTELLYRRALLEEPENPLLLCNYAQFLYLVIRNLDRAEEYFKRAIRVEPPDADSLLRYAAFLWLARNDLVAAEETYLRAVEADPSNPFFASCYASFLWVTGGADTCYPLS